MTYQGLHGTSVFQVIAIDQAGNQGSFNATINVVDAKIQGASSVTMHMDYLATLVSSMFVLLAMLMS